MNKVESFVHQGTPLNRVAYLSFSRSAAEVIKDRMMAKDRDVCWFRTIHGAACKALGLGSAIIQWQGYADFSKRTGMRITPDDRDEYDFARGIDYNVCLRALNMSLTTCKPLAEVVKAMPDHPNLQAKRLQAFIEAWTKYKRDAHKFDFMDMLTEYERYGEPLPIDKACLDEAQDCSELQWRCFHKMTATCNEIHMAGDDDQTIFSFIGASEFGFLEHPADEETVITKSWRVPEAIGHKADRVINHIAHRKAKQVEWKREPGSVRVYNLEALTMPWAKWLREYHSVMVLHRHRRGATEFSSDLKLLGIPHTYQGETANSWPEAKILHTLYALADGKSVTPRAAQVVAEAFGKPTGVYRAMGLRDRVTEIPGLSNERAWRGALTNSSNKRTRDRYAALFNLISKQGYCALAMEPQITVQTMHGSKGEEADLVVIVPDCTNVVKQNIESATEVRLSYVALTRAKRDVAISVPRTDTYINYFF
jgi:superfamily I DNA/RNA helicase